MVVVGQMVATSEKTAARVVEQENRLGITPGGIAARYTMTMTYINSAVDALPWLDLDWADPDASLGRVSREWLGNDW